MTRLRTPWLLPMALLSAACGEIAPDCGEGAVLLNSEEGGYALQAFSFDYSWDADAGVQVGPTYTFAVPYDTTGLAVTTEVADRQTGFNLFAFDEQTWIDGYRQVGNAGGWASAPYFHWAELGGTVAMPITPETVPDGGGCLQVQPAVLRNQAGPQGTLYLMSRRDEPRDYLIDVNVMIVGNTAFSQSEMDTALARVSVVWGGGGGPTLGQVHAYNIPGNSVSSRSQLEQLRAYPVEGAAAQAVNLVVVDDVAGESGLLGMAGGIPGPIGVQGEQGAAVVVALDGHRNRNGSLDTDLLGETIAHEVGHQMGLFHTTEWDGSRSETLSDTAECPISQMTQGAMYANPCQNWDGKNFMFWTAGNLNQDEVTPMQAQVLSSTSVVY